MNDVIYLRPMDPPVTPAGVLDSIKYAGGCFDLHRVEWVHSFVAADGGRMLCWYRAPDAESARLALRELGSDLNAVWPGRILGGVAARDPAVDAVGMLAEVELAAAWDDSDEALQERLSRSNGDGAPACRFAFLANRRDRLVCFMDGGEADRARAALQQAGLAPTLAWPCTVVTP